jgi:hypothetical protein
VEETGKYPLEKISFKVILINITVDVFLYIFHGRHTVLTKEKNYTKTSNFNEITLKIKYDF